MVIKQHHMLTSVSGAIAMAIVYGSFSGTPAIEGPEIGDKWLHFSAYAMFSFITVLPRHSVRKASMMMSLTILLSGLIELIQPFFGRNGEFADLMANSLGVFAGGILAISLGREISQRGRL